MSEIWKEKKIEKTDKNTENEEIKISMFTKGMSLYVENLNFFVKTTMLKYIWDLFSSGMVIHTGTELTVMKEEVAAHS